MRKQKLPILIYNDHTIKVFLLQNSIKYQPKT